MCMGNTPGQKRVKRRFKVHPHVYGEYYRPNPPYTPPPGSIPMCMGNTKLGTHWDCICRVHPHVYGEYTVSWSAYHRYEGPSPCVWGILELVTGVRVPSGSIPMCMGNTNRGDRLDRAL